MVIPFLYFNTFFCSYCIWWSRFNSRNFYVRYDWLILSCLNLVYDSYTPLPSQCSRQGYSCGGLNILLSAKRWPGKYSLGTLDLKQAGLCRFVKWT